MSPACLISEKAQYGGGKSKSKRTLVNNSKSNRGEVVEGMSSSLLEEGAAGWFALLHSAPFLYPIPAWQLVMLKSVIVVLWT